MLELAKITTAGVQLRNEDSGAGLLTGPAVIYGDVALTRRGRETVHPGAFLGLILQSRLPLVR